MKTAILSTVLLGTAMSVTHAQGLTAVRPVPGWECMKLNQTEQQAMDPTIHVVERTAPSATAKVGGWAPPTVAVPSPPVATNGFLPVLRPNGQRLWIAKSDVVAWSALADPAARCAPYVMSNGIYGFNYTH